MKEKAHKRTFLTHKTSLSHSPRNEKEKVLKRVVTSDFKDYESKSYNIINCPPISSSTKQR